MKITNVKIFKTTRKGPVLAYANVILDNNFIIRGITLLESEKNGRFISMPSRRILGKKVTYRNMYNPLNNELREKLTKKIFDAYDEFLISEEE